MIAFIIMHRVQKDIVLTLNKIAEFWLDEKIFFPKLYSVQKAINLISDTDTDFSKIPMFPRKRLKISQV